MFVRKNKENEPGGPGGFAAISLFVLIRNGKENGPGGSGAPGSDFLIVLKKTL